MKKNLKQNIFAGIFALLPVILTVYLIKILFKFFANPGSVIIEWFLDKEDIPQYVPEVTGFILTFLFIFILGAFVRNIVGKKILQWFDDMVSRIPIVNNIYKTIKQITSTLSSPGAQAFQKVVMIQYPRKGIWTLTMVTGESVDKKDKEYYHLFVPTTPNPTSGFMLFVPKSDTKDTAMSVEEGMKVVISGGLVAPDINDI